MAFENIKIPAIVSFWIIMIICGLLPICIKKFKKIDLLMSLSNCFTAGLFVATGLVHILPEANESITEGMTAAADPHSEDDHGDEEHAHGISYAHLTLLLAFSFILFIEKVLLNSNSKASSKQNHPESLNKAAHDPIKSNKTAELKSSEEEILNNVTEANKENLEPDQNLKLSNIISVHSNQIIVNPQSGELNQEAKTVTTQSGYTGNLGIISDQHNPKSKHDDHEGHNHLNVSNDSSVFSIVVILFALGIHGFMANLSIGIEDNKDTLITLIIAVALHKWSEGLAIGIILAKKNFSKLKNVLIILFISIFTPIGGIVGMVLENANEVVKGVMLSVSAAAFLYIGVVEIIVEEFKYSDWKYLKFLIYSLGIGLVMILFLIH